MGAAVIGSALVGAAIALPWLILLPLGGVAGVIASAVTLVAAFHGAGLVVARFSGSRTASPWLVIQWGAATLIGLSGIALALGAGTLAGHAVLVFGGAAAHTVVLGLRFTHYAARIDAGLAGPRTWLVPAALLAALGTLAVLGAAGDPLPQPFDDEGHVLAQVQRVLDTGALGDPIGYPRGAQLGGQIALAAVAAGAGDGFAWVVEALALVLALGLALSRIRGRDASSALWAVVLVVTAFALALAPTDPQPCWTAVGLIVALYTMMSDVEAAPPLPLAITAGALIALRYELAPIAAVALLAEWWRRRADHQRTAILIAGVFAVGFPFLVARMLAWRSVPQIAHATIAAPPQAALVLRLLLAAVIAVPAAYVLRLVLPDNRAVRAATTATAVALAALAAHASGAGPYAMRLAWPIAIGFAILVVIELARSRWAGPTGLIASLLMCLVIHEGREAPGWRRWSRRIGADAIAISYVQRPPVTAAAPYRELLANAAPGATVAVWIAAPEHLDYTRHRIFDLRTPAVARLREFRWTARASRIEPLLAQLSAGYLLFEADDAHVLRTQTDLLYRLACQTARPICADDLEAVTQRNPIVARRDNVWLVDLRRQ